MNCRLEISGIVLRALTIGLLICLGSVRAGQEDDRERFFEQKIRPLLADHCVSCHGPELQEGGIRLDSRQQVIQGGDDRSALVAPGETADSRIFQVVQYAADDVQMPPDGKLGDHQLAAISEWIQSGAHWPEGHTFGLANAVDSRQWREHWAFKPVVAPVVTEAQSGRHPIDVFVGKAQLAAGMGPSTVADGRTLVRRIAYAVTGLPPDLGDLNTATVIRDQSQFTGWLNAYVDRLLATPQFGERWARYWLDIARFADTKGYVFREDREYKDAWRFRDWVISSLNEDMPYDQFLRMQLAADQMTPDDGAQLAAMGFLTLGRRFLNNKHDIIDDRIDVTCRGMMALTVTCARCHDHKFDPVSTVDYYALYGIFDSSHEPRNEPSPLRLVDRDQPRTPVVFVRGNPHNRGETVERRFLSALSTDESQPYTNGSGRLQLAEHITSADNPLTARVAVNRIWLRLFGQGLVEMPSDFGVRTPAPLHAELLDHLAAYFVEANWSRKSIIRYIIRSNTWRQSSVVSETARDADPANRLLSRMNRRRLDFEAFRDSVLAVSGDLDYAMGGESVDISEAPFANCRTVYARIDRQNLPGVFRTFDFASPDSHSAQRFETTIPQQALFQLNNPFMMDQASKLSGQLTRWPSTSIDDQIHRAYQRVLRRAPTIDEARMSRMFVKSVRAATDATAAEDHLEPLAQFVQTLMLTNEFFFID